MRALDSAGGGGHPDALEQVVHDVRSRAPGHLRLPGGHEAVGEDGDRDLLHVVRQHVVTAGEGGVCAGGPQQVKGGAR